MNFLFLLVFIGAAIALLFTSPESFLTTLLDGASKGASLCVSLIATYAVWMGLMQVWQDSGVSRAVSKLLRPLAKKLFKTQDGETLDALCMNMSVNLLGISGAATPYGIKAARLLEQSPQAEYASAMLLVLNATSLQLLPTSLISVRAALHSAAPTDIVLPTLLTTLFTTVIGVLAVRIFLPPHRKKQPAPLFCATAKKYATRGAGV